MNEPHDEPLEPIAPVTGQIPRLPQPVGEAGGKGVPRPDRFTDLGLLLLTLIWGVNFAVIKVALDALDPLAFNALRFPIASAVVLLVLRLRGPLRLPGRRDWPALVLLGLLGNTLYQFFFIYGIAGTGAGNAALLLATTPVWTILLSALLGHEPAGRAVWIGAFGTFAGMSLVIAGGGAAVELGGATLAGDLLMVGSSMVWATYTVSARGLIRRYGSLQVTAWSLWAGTAGIVAVGALPVARTPVADVPASAWGGVFYAGALAVGVAYALWNRGVGRIGHARTSVYSNLVPVVALAVAWVWLSEVPTRLQLAGAAIILGSLFLARFGGWRPRRFPGPSSAGAPGTRTGAGPRS